MQLPGLHNDTMIKEHESKYCTQVFYVDLNRRADT